MFQTFCMYINHKKSVFENVIKSDHYSYCNRIIGTLNYVVGHFDNDLGSTRR